MIHHYMIIGNTKAYIPMSYLKFIVKLWLRF